MSDEPIRLLDDPTAPEGLRRDIEEEARASWDYDAAAGLAALQAAIRSGAPLPDLDAPDPETFAGPKEPPAPVAGPAASPAAASGSAASAAATVTKSGIFLKSVLIGLAALGLTAAAVGILARDAAAPSGPLLDSAAPSALVAARGGTAPPPEEPPVASFAAPPEAPSDPPQAREGVPPAAFASPAGEAKAAPKPSAKKAAPEPRASAETRPLVAEEIEHMRALREKAATDPAEALRLAAEDEARFPGGLFALEREYIVVSSLARLGRAAEARRRGERFIAAHPKSPYADRVRAALGEQAP